MEFNPTKTVVKIIKEVAFAGTYFRNIYFGVMENGTKICGKNLINLTILILSFIAQIIVVLNWIDAKLKLEHH